MIGEATPHSVDSRILYTKRQHVVRLERMSKERIRSIPEYSQIFDRSDAAALAEIAWKVLGGNPMNFMHKHVMDRKSQEKRTIRVSGRGFYIAEFLTDSIYEAICTISMFK